MALTAVERKVLIAAREEIQTRKKAFICYAITDAKVGRVNRDELRRAKNRLMTYIRFSLGGSATLGGWLNGRYGRWPTPDVQRKARIAWINWMLDEPIIADGDSLRAFQQYKAAGPLDVRW